MNDSRLDLPMPLGPRIERISPGRTVKSSGSKRRLEFNERRTLTSVSGLTMACRDDWRRAGR